MLTIVVPPREGFDETLGDHGQFVLVGDPFMLELEHSLVSLSKWESIWEKPFLSKTPMTPEESLSYIKCMTLTPDVPPEVFQRLSTENFGQIKEYMDAKRTATFFSESHDKRPSRDVITTELIYYWLASWQIPFHPTETWHFNRLLTLLRVADVKNNTGKKMSKSDILSRQRALNQKRRAELQTKG